MGVLVCAALGASCGGGAGGGSCGKVQPCGGNPIGTWKFTRQCTTSAEGFMNALCPTATFSPADLNATGTATFSPDFTYTLSLTLAGTVQAKVPASCLMQGPFMLTCATVGPLIQTALASDPESPVTSVTCTGSSDCSCMMGISISNDESGTWAVNGTKLARNGSGGDDFCVQGSELHLLTANAGMPAGSMGQVEITSDVVAVKQ
jgi:hypothetical protein